MEHARTGAAILWLRDRSGLPAPIVDHPTAYRHAQEKMHHLRQRDDSKREARRIQKRHGSRKQGSKKWR